MREESKTVIRLTLQKLEISSDSMGHLACKGFSFLASVMGRFYIDRKLINDIFDNFKTPNCFRNRMYRPNVLSLSLFSKSSQV